MMRAVLDRVVTAATSHNRLVILLMLVLTAGMIAGTTQLAGDSQAGGTTAAFPETDESRAADYVSEQYDHQPDSQQTASIVYVRHENENALSKTALLEALRYQRTVLETEAVANNVDDDTPTSVANIVARRAADDPDATLDEQITALETTSDEEIDAILTSTLTEESQARSLLPESYDPGTARAESHRMVYQFTAGEDATPPSNAQRALYDAASDRDAYFTMGEHATAESSRQMNENTLELILPVALVLILGTLAVAYRDIVDVIIGMIGVVVSIIWMFGILGWLGVDAGMTMIIGPVLIAGLSIDFGFHVFTRYREARGPGDGIREPMAAAMRGVALALGLVTATAALGFLSNLVNPVDAIRDLGIGITLGVIAAFVIFITLVPALKVSVDGLLERLGRNRRYPPLGSGSVLRPLLSGSVRLARTAGPLILIVALLGSAGGAAAWGALDEESFQQQRSETADWKQDLPGPLAWEDPALQDQRRYVQSEYTAVASDDSERFQILIRGDVTSDDSLTAIDEATDRAIFETPRSEQSLASPVTVIRTVAAENDAFAATVRNADTDNDGLPDTNLAAVYDHLYAVAPDQAQRVLERENGEYQSLRVIGPVESAGMTDDRVDDVTAAAATIEDADTDLSATAVSDATVLDSQFEVVTDGIVRVLVIALATVFVGLVVTFALVHGRAALGVMTALPVLMVVGLVVGGMYLLDVPVTLVTALLMSLVIGLGIDYNIHVGDRFAQELDHGRPPSEALETAVTGTGGALVGSTLTSAGAFATILLHPHPQLQSFGILVILTLTAAVLASVVVLPSLLACWMQYAPSAPNVDTPSTTASGTSDD